MTRSRPIAELRFLFSTIALMLVLYALAYHPYSETSLPGRSLIAYLGLAARASAAVLGWLGEPVGVAGTLVTGRFPYVVVLDCAALDAQSLFAAAVLAFPASIFGKSVGLVAGLAGIWIINVGRLVVLYFAGVRSLELFRVLHEEVLVVSMILAVCGLFFAWTSWVRRRAPAPPRDGVHGPAAAA